MSLKANAQPKLNNRTLFIPFLRGLLDDASHQDTICWTDKANLRFKIVNRQKLTELWGATKKTRKAIMTYDNMCRNFRKLCADGKELAKIDGAVNEWRLLESGGTQDSNSSDSPDASNAQDPLLFSIQKLLSGIGIPILTDSTYTSVEVSKEKQKPVSFNAEEALSNKVVPNATESSSAFSEVATENQKPCNTSWKVKPSGFESKMSRLNGVIHALKQKAKSAQVPME